jgi:hypothetical protein
MGDTSTGRAAGRGGQLAGTVVSLVVAIPVVGFLMGGVYWLPACHVTGGREPHLTCLLALGLAVTLFAIGLPSGVAPSTLGAAWLVCLLLLLLSRRLRGDLSHDVERFFPAHFAALLLGLVLTAARWNTR